MKIRDEIRIRGQKGKFWIYSLEECTSWCPYLDVVDSNLKQWVVAIEDIEEVK